MTQLEKIKIMLGLEGTEKDNLLTLLLEQAQNELLQYTNRDELPQAAANVVIDMAVVKYNLLGTEGLSSQSFSGASEAYSNYPPQLIKAMNRYRRLRLL